MTDALLTAAVQCLAALWLGCALWWAVARRKA